MALVPVHKALQSIPSVVHPANELRNMKRPASPSTVTRTLTGLLPVCVLALSFPAQAAITIQSYWQLGENPSNRGADTVSVDGELNPFNNTAGTTWNTTSASGVNGSTTYASTSGVNFQGIWMFGTGSNNQTIPSDNWGVQFMVRSTAQGSIGTGDFRAVFGMAEGVSGGLVIEAANVGGTVYWDVNRQATANFIIPRNASTIVTSEWTSLALVKNAGTIEFYVDRQLVGSSSGSVNVSGLFAFGLQQNVGTKGFQGDFDEASFFTFDAGQFNSATDLIPEPTCALLGGLGMLSLLRRRR
jgi:hypothetical protein